MGGRDKHLINDDEDEEEEEEDVYMYPGDMTPDERCNTPKYTLVVFDMFRVFCKCKFDCFMSQNAKPGNERSGKLQNLRAIW